MNSIKLTEGITMNRDLKLQKSFENVKTDMAHLYSYIDTMRNRVVELEDTNMRLISAMTVLGEIVAAGQKRQLEYSKPIKRISSRKISSKIVASKTGKKVHTNSCAFAKSIKAINKREFASKVAARKAGYKLCKCMK